MRNLTRPAVFGLSDGMMSLLGVVLYLLGHQSLILPAAISGAISSALSMAGGEWLSDSDSGIGASCVMGAATGAGAVLPALPFAFASGRTALGCMVLICIGIGVLVALMRTGRPGCERSPRRLRCWPRSSSRCCCAACSCPAAQADREADPVQPLLHVLGLDDPSGRWYLWWSGAGSFLEGLGFLGALIGVYQRHTCAIHTCWRIARRLSATGDRLCHRHHPCGRLTHAQAVDEHHAAACTAAPSPSTPGEPVTLTFRGGRLPAQPARPHLSLAPYAAGLAAPPTAADWLFSVPAAAWGMLANDQWGDCTCAGVGHKRIGDVFVNQGRVLTVTDQDALALYSAVTGFDPADPSTDQGAVCQDVLAYWQKTGFLGEKIVAYAKVDLSNQTLVKQAIALFGQIYCGFNFPSSAMDQFNAGQPWDVVKGAQIEGGHCVTIGAYDANGLECVTWGKVQKLTWRFLAKYFDEAWVIVTPDQVNSGGLDAQGLDLYALGQDYAALTGRPNPIPAPAPSPTPTPAPPQPTPTPTPAPAPGPDAADKALATAFKTWASAKGL